MPDIREVAHAFMRLLKEGRFDEAAETFNAADIVSLEPFTGEGSRVEGAAAVRAKSEWWAANHEVHAFEAQGPFLNGDQFALTFKGSITVKATGERITVDEVGLYTVRDGKIVEERFYYDTP
jgi:ketosteroid isomerase-like protein